MDMSNTSRQWTMGKAPGFGRWALALTIAAGTFALDVTPGRAVDLNRPAGIETLNRPGELQIYESRQRRREFQQQQQNEREDDRQTVITAPPRLDVPRMQGSCQIRLNGSRYMTVCR